MDGFKFLSLWVLMFFIAGCAPAPRKSERYRETRTMMGTTVHLDVCLDASNKTVVSKAYQEVWDRLEDIAWRMNVFDERSDVAKINRAGTQPVEVREDTYYVLQKSIDYNRLTLRAFDITVWPLIQLWKRGARENVLPTTAQLQEARGVIGPDQIQLLSDGRVRLTSEGAKIDLGGIAAGYAVDEAARIFRENGIRNFFIDISGDIYVGGRNCEGDLWRIGIRDPRDLSQIIDIVRLSDMAVATSGNYEQYYEIQNERWSHIMNPITGYPQKDVVSATMIAPSALETDAWSTAMSVLGPRSGIPLVNAMPLAGEKYACLIITRNSANELVRFPSAGYEKFQGDQ